MKILHVTDELSKRNYSISSLIFFLSNFFQKTQNISYKILASEIQTDVFEKNEKIKIIKFERFSDIFNKDVSIKESIWNSNVVHIHGLWRAINLLVVFYCVILKKNFFIHPHGMLLDSALKNKGLVNYFFKRIILAIFNFCYGSNLNFISITNDEIKSIYRFFPNSKNIFIPNPVTQYQSESQSRELKKRFVYFGRIHSIKNIDLMIAGFTNANLDSEWSLEIYGIPDDLVYEKYLRKKIKNLNNIKIMEPVFGDAKTSILQSAWANLLLSKSEVLSLSVLESASLGLPSLVNKNIKIDKFEEHEGEITSLKINEISKKINEISQWSEELRLKKASKLQKFISENYSMDKIYQKYIPVYENLNENQNSRTNKNIFKYFFEFFFNSSFINTSVSYLFNFMIPTFIMLMVTFAYNKSLAADIAITSSFLITLTQIFSSNMKAQILANNDIKLISYTLLFRFIFVIFFVLFFILIYFSQTIFVYEKFTTVFLISLIILLQWIYEIVLCNKEIKKENSTFVFYNIVNFLFLILYFLIILFYPRILDYVLAIYILFIFSFLLNGMKDDKINLKIQDYRRSVSLNLKSLAFLSSTSLIVSSIVWRLIIFNLFTKEISAILFACFSLGSFPGTAFNLAIGPTYVRKNISLSKKLKQYIYVFYSFLFGLSCLSAYILFINRIDLIPNNYFIFYTLSFSLLGSFFMTYAMYVRQKSIQLTYERRTNVFVYDIIYGTSICFYCPLLYYVGREYGTSLSFFLASITAFLIYTIIIRNMKFKNVTLNQK